LIRPRILVVMDSGQPAIMLAEFQPNGGVSFTQGMKYKSHQYLCAHDIATRQREGRMVVLCVSDLPTLQDLYCFCITTALKFQSVDWFCFDLTSAIGGCLSYNDGVDSVAHLLKYFRDVLPNLHDICEMVCGVWDAYPECEYLDGVTVDVRTAYNQHQVQPSKAKLLDTFFTSLGRPAAGGHTSNWCFWGEFCGGKVDGSEPADEFVLSHCLFVRGSSLALLLVIMVAPPFPASWDDVDLSVKFPATEQPGVKPAGGTSVFHGIENHRCALWSALLSLQTTEGCLVCLGAKDYV
jgi:hypothetical protein